MRSPRIPTLMHRVACAVVVCGGVALSSGCGADENAPERTAERAAALMRDLADRGLFQGAVVVGRAGRVAYAEGFGLADREQQVPFTPDTPMDGGSTAKPFTATILLQLAAEGRVDLEAPVVSIIPEFPHAATRVRHLLTHAAGLPSYAWLDARATPGEVRTNASHLTLVARDAKAPAFTPGTGFEYDNVAYDIAAMVIERVTDSSYASVIAERFARPLALEAFVRPARFSEWAGVRTRGYRRVGARWEDHDALDLEGFYGAANLYVSARDLHDWMAGYRDLVGPATLRAATAPARLDDGRTTGLSMGSWYVSADGGRRYYTGHHNGFFSFAYADDVRAIAIAWVANDATPPWLQPALSRALIAIAEGREREAFATPEAPAAADTTVDPTGEYRVPGVGDVGVTSDGTQLRVRVSGVVYAAFPVAPGMHYVPGLDAYLSFGSTNGRAQLRWDSVFRVATGAMTGTGPAVAHLPSLGKARPVDDASRDPVFAAFRDSVLRIVARRDTSALLAIVAPEIKSSFGGDDGIAGFRAHWKLGEADTKLWSVLEDVLRHGGRFGSPDAFWAPWTFQALPDSLDAFEHLMVRDSAVAVHERADSASAVLGLLSYDIVRAGAYAPESAWRAIKLADGRDGYVASQHIRSAVEYRAGFERRSGRWWLVILVAGD